MNKAVVTISLGVILGLGITNFSIAQEAPAAAPAAAPAQTAPAAPVDPNAVVTNGKKIKMEYTLFVDGQMVQTSKGQPPLEFVQGSGDIIPGLAKQLEGMKFNEEKKVSIAPDEAYGQVNPEAVQDFPKTSFPEDFRPEVGQVIEMQAPDGQAVLGVIMEIKTDALTVNFNHPLAGKTLDFEVKVVGIE
jgi:FKBP-type peptidyl-prolyl cis-trans isomerase 2